MKTHTFRQPMPIRRERGVVLVFALIALLILMIGAVALVRSFNTSLLGTGSIAFKKDLVNRNEAAVARVLARARTAGNLMTASYAAAAQTSMNYSPQIVSYNAQGIPDLLLVNDSDFNASGIGLTSNDIQMPDDNVTLRYIIDRQCNAPGDAATLGSANCVTVNSTPDGGSADVPIRAEMSTSGGSGAVPISPVYRLSIRAVGPKGTLAFYQTTFTLQ
ncbi:MAG: hypothetical protein KF891_17990 [Rhizobacter sp.]|nr:hypothetical protein [Rhizobacter sp.]